jgi:hypothetical protein
MPCALCGNQGHNRRTCQQWHVLEASRQHEERINEDQTVHTPININIDIDIHDPYNLREIFTTPEIQRRMLSNPPAIQRYNISPLPFPINDINIPTQLFPDSDFIPFNDSLFGDDDSDDSLPDLEPIKKNNVPLIDCAEEPCKTEDCPICMEELKQTDILITRCGHQFHGTCMIRHMKLNDNCPMCRGVLFTNTITN